MGLFCGDVEDMLIWAIVATQVFIHAISEFLQGFALRPRLHPVIEIGFADRFNPVLPFLSQSDLHWPCAGQPPCAFASHVRVNPLV